MGDDRRLNILIKTFFQWYNIRGKVPEEESDLMYNRMLHLLTDADYSAEKSFQVQGTFKKEIDIYDQLMMDMKEQIDSTKDKIEEVKESLVKAREIRSNRMEYEPLVHKIEQFPPRPVSLERLAKIKKDKEILMEKKKEVEARIEMRKNQIQTLVSQSESLLSSLNQDEAFVLEDLPEEEEVIPTKSKSSKSSDKAQR